MRGLRAWGKSLLLGGALGIVPALFLEGLRLTVGIPFSWTGLVARWGFVAGMLVAACLTRPHPVRGPRFLWSGFLWLGPGIVVGLIYGLSRATWAAWAVVGIAYILLFGLEPILAYTRSRLRRWLWWVLLALTV